MSIRPVDYLPTIPKSQEMSKVKQMESDKLETQIHHMAVEQEKETRNNMQKVRDTNKSEGSIIDPKKKDNRREESEKKKKKSRKRNKKNKKTKTIGSHIDIKV